MGYRYFYLIEQQMSAKN